MKMKYLQWIVLAICVGCFFATPVGCGDEYDDEQLLKTSASQEVCTYAPCGDENFCQFLGGSTPFHCVDECCYPETELMVIEQQGNITWTISRL